MGQELPELSVTDAAAWRVWLEAHHGEPQGVWLALARKGHPGLFYDEALEEALCFGWIDGQVRRGDGERFYWQRFTPRRPRSGWSKRNVQMVGRLEAEGRLREAGRAAVARAQADGRWEAAYEGSARAAVPPDLAAALAADPVAAAAFAGLSSQNRYAIIYRLGTLRRAETRERRVREYVEMLARGETIHPQQDRRPPAWKDGSPQNSTERAP